MLSKSNKLRIVFYSLFLIFLGYNFYPTKEIDPQLEVYYNEYISLYNEVCPEANYTKPIQMNIQFDELEGEIIGYCKEHLTGWTVKIDRTFWSYSTEAYKQSLIKHELSHCVLKIDHNDKIKNHYMNSRMTDTPLEMIDLQLRGDMVKRCREIHVRTTN